MFRIARIASAAIALLIAVAITPSYAGGYASALAVSGGVCDNQALGLGVDCYADQQVQVQQYVQPQQVVVQRQYVQPVQQVVESYVQPVQQVRVIQRVVQVPSYAQQQLNVGIGYGAQAQAFAGGGYSGSQQFNVPQRQRRGFLGLGAGGGKQVTKSRSFARSRTVTRGR